MNLLNELLFLVFQVDNDLDINEIKVLSERMAAGIEGITCSYNPDDEDYEEGFVTIDYWLGLEDRTEHIEKQVFFDALHEICEKHVGLKPDDKNLIEGYLSKIKTDLCLK